jgi:hypothetical protein
MFEGEWESSGEAEFAMLDRILTSAGSSTVGWENDGWCLVERGEFEMEEFGEMKGMGVWTYDPRSKKYRTSWFDSMGGVGHGTAKYDEDTRTWKFKAKAREHWGTSTGRGTVTFLDNDTAEWNWSQRVFFGLFKVFEMNGTMRRK